MTDAVPPTASSMDKTFDPAAVEARISAGWEAQGCFRAGRPERMEAEPFCIVIPPPNVTGSLHMGHALNHTLQDILCRFERMRGKDVLWQPGTDHAGIATQMVVERKLADAQQQGRRELGRERFLEKVWEQKEASEQTILGQLKRLGASCDWSRTRFTMDQGLSDAVLRIFVTLHRDGLIYRDKRLVNWDPQFQSAISDLEVVQLETKGTFAWTRGESDLDAAALDKALGRNPGGHLYYFDYPVHGEVYDPENGDSFITVATTRPETLLGDTGVAVHPDNETLRGFIGRQLVLPLVGRIIPIVGDEYADPDKGTGAVKITPAHDFNDFDVGKRHGLRAISIFDAEAKLKLEPGSDFDIDVAPSSDLDALLALNGIDRFEARRRVIAMMAERGLLARIEPHAQVVPHGDRSNVPIEPFLTDQWYVDVKPLAERALAAVDDGRTRFVPENWKKTYDQWLTNIQPWCVSRQLWWGHQIPAWYGPDGQVFVAETEAEAAGVALAHYVENDVLTSAEAFVLAEDADKRAAFLTRDEDVLDTWFSSALWPFSTLGWPEQTPELTRYYPTNVLVTGFDIIFFWVARMMMAGLHVMDEVPFRDVYIHALVRDEKGAKMSKSKGNVIDPLALIDTYGADALRFTLAAMAAQGRDIKLSVARVEGYRNFSTKLWNAARFAEMNGCRRSAAFDPDATTTVLNRWALGEAANATREITAAIEAYRFNDAANAAYRFVWGTFCDWYLELAKPVLQGPDSSEKRETQACIAHVLDVICRLLHPFMPFITEELWELTGRHGAPRETMLALAAWPTLNGFDAADAEAEIGWLVDLVSEIRSVRAEMNVPGAAAAPLVLVAAADDTVARAQRFADTLKRLARVSEVQAHASAPPQSAQVLVRGEAIALPLAGLIDLDAEKTRLLKEADRLRNEVAAADAKLGNDSFVARAPEEVVEEMRERREAAVARGVKVADALARLG